ncbi:hypothetical protein Droror1_Dr00025459 [Drosera rotundifolia]
MLVEKVVWRGGAAVWWIGVRRWFGDLVDEDGAVVLRRGDAGRSQCVEEGFCACLIKAEGREEIVRNGWVFDGLDLDVLRELESG